LPVKAAELRDFERELPAAPRVHIDVAAAQTLEALDAPSGIPAVVE
jgi:hypothetical protein